MVIFPGLAPRLTRLRNDVPAPLLLAGVDIQTRHPPASSGIARAVLDNHGVIGNERRRPKGLAATELVDGRHLVIPDNLPIVTMDGDDPSVRQIGQDQLLPQRDPPRP